MAKLNKKNKHVQTAMQAVTQGTAAGGQRKPLSFTPDAELAGQRAANAKQYAPNAQQYAAKATEWIARYRKQQEEARERQQRMQGMYDATAAYEQGGKATASPTYEQLVQNYYANAPTKSEAYDRIMANGGFGAMTQKQLDAMMDPGVYKPTADVNAWQWMTDPKYQQASRDALVNQATDMQTAMAYGAYDTPQYLLGGHSELVSDEYLQYLMGVLPGLQQEQEDEWQKALAGYEQRKGLYAYRPDDLYELSEYAAVFADEGNQDADYEFFDQYTNEWYGDPGEYGSAIGTLIEVDNAMNGTSHDAGYLNGLSSAQRGRELSRMLSQYYNVQLLASGMPNTLDMTYADLLAEPDRGDYSYPYDAVMDLVQNEIQSREVMVPYLAAVVNDPHFMERIDYKAPQGELTSEAGTPYVVINNGGMWGASVNTSLMTDMERAVFNYHYNMGDRKGAETYFQAILPELAERTRIIDRVGWEELATDNVFTGALSWAAVRGANLGAAFMYPVDAARAAMGTDYGLPGVLSDYGGTVTGAQLGALEDYDWLGVEAFGQNIPQWLYSTASSMADMGLAHAVGGATGWAHAPLALMGAEAAAADLASTAGSDMEAWERILHSGLVGGTEVATEKLPFDAYTSNPGAKGYMLRNVLSEMGEEGFNAIAGRGIDELTAALAGRESPTQSRIKQMEMLGVEAPEGEEAAAFLQEVGGQAFGGGLAGFGMGGSAAAVDTMQSSATGRKVTKNGGVDALIDIGRGMDSKTESARMAAEMTKTGETGKKNAARKVGRLYRTLLQETAQEYHDNLRTAAVDAVEQAMDQRYEELGIAKETDYTTREMAEAIVDAQGSKAGVKGEIGKYIKTSRVPQAIMREFGANDTEWTQSLQQRRVVETLTHAGKVGAITATARKSESAEAAAGDEGKPNAIETETQERVEGLTRRKKPSEAFSRVIAFAEDESKPQVEGEFVRLEGTGSDMQIVVDRDGERKSIPLPQVRQVSGSGIARVIAYAEAHPEVQAEEANSMISLLEETDGKAQVKASEVISAYETGVKAGFTGAERPALSEVVEPVTKGEKATAALETALEMGYKQGVKESSGAEERRREAAKGRSRGIAAVAYMGEVENAANVEDTGVRESAETIMKDLTPQQNAAVRALGTLSDATGIGFTLFKTKAADGEELQTPNGFYDPGTNSIFIDLQSGASRGGETMVESAILKTASHELTHYIEKNSQEGYEQLRSAVKKLLGERGKDYWQLMTAKIRESSHKLTRVQAEAEVIADACEMMLKDSTAVETLAKDNPTLWEKMKTWLKDFARRVRRAFSGLTATSEEAAALTEIRDGVERYIGNLQQLWDNALVEAAETAKTSGETIAPEAEKAAEEVREATEATQFQMRTPVEQRSDGLMAVHNLSAAKLTDTLELGGFPMPSIAVIKAKHGHTMYGDYSVIFGKDAIDPEKNDANRVYGNDAWTPTFPQVETEIDSAKLLDVRRMMSKSVEAINGYLAQRVQQYFNQLAYQEETTKRLPDLQDNAWENHGMLAAYLNEQGKTFDIKTHEVPIDRGYNVENAEIYDAILDVMGDNVNVSMRGIDIIEKYGQALADANEILARFYRRYQDGDRRSGIAMLTRVRQAKAYNDAGRDTTVQTKTENDYDATRLGMQGQIDRTAYNTWVKGVLEQFMGKKGIYNGKERFTQSGNRRSFKYLHDAYTAENVIRAMQKEPESDIVANDAKGLQAAAARRYDSIEAIREDSSRLGKVREEEYNAALTEIDKELHDFFNSIGARDYDEQERAGNLLVRAAKSSLVDSGIVRLFKSNGFKTITPADAQQAQEIIRQAQNTPTGYFEAKPARVVTFDEIRMVVAPYTMPDALAKALTERGIPYVIYDGTDADRIAKMNAVENVQFSERRGKPDLSVRDALMAITDHTGMTTAESSLLTRYQGNVLKLEEVTEAIKEQTEIRDNKELPEKERTEAKKELWRLKRQRFAIERALIEAENEGGYAKLMTTAGEMVRLLTTKDTLPDVTAALQEQIGQVSEQLAQVQAALGEQAEADMWNTMRALFDQTKLRAAAKKLKALYGSRISEKTLMNRIVLMQTTLLRGGENASAEYLRLGEELVRELRSKGQQDNEMLAALKEYIGTITLTETQRQEINNTIGMKEFLAVVRPVVKVVPKGKASVTLDVLLEEANAAEGGANPILPYFEGYEGEGDSILRLYELIKGAKSASPYVGRYGQEQLQAEMIDVMSIAAEASLVDAGAETVKTVMDALTKNAEGSDELTAKVRQLRIEMAKAGRAAGTVAWKADERHKAMGDVIEYLTHLETQNQLLEKQDSLRTIERQVAEQSNERIKEIIAERNVMERNRVMRERIRRTVGWMVTRIRRETDRKNVPEELKPYIEDAIRMFAEHNDVLRVFKRTEVADIRRYFEALKKYDTKTQGALNDLIEEEMQDAFKELRVNLEEYAEAGRAESKKKTMLRNKSLAAIDDIVQMLWGQINKWNEIFIGGKQAQLSDVAEDIVGELKGRKNYAVADHAGGTLWEMVKDAARNKNLTPIFFFRLLGNKVMQTLNDDVVEGQREYGIMLAEAKKTVEELQAQYHYWTWKNAAPLEFTTEQGKRTKDGMHDVSLTVDEAMSIWAIWLREQDTTPLFESTHLSNGGFVLASGKRRVNGKLVADKTPHKLTEADMRVIDQWLTEEQKAYAKAVVEYLSKDMAEIGNRASMRMYGIKKFKEEHYFPMGVQRDQLAQSSNKGAKNPDANRIAGVGFSKRRVERAWKPLSIGSFTEVAANHINEMLLYGTFAVPIENFNSILNYNYVKNAAGEDLNEEDVSIMTVRALFSQKYGDQLTKYLETYLADLNGGTGVKENNKLMSLYRRSAVMASVSVMLQQPLSIIRAWMVQNPKYYLKAFSGKAAAPDRKEWEQLCKYSGAAVLKNVGGFDMTSTRTMGGYLAGTAEDTYSLAQKAGALVGVNAEGERLGGIKRQAEELLGMGAQKADQLAWTYMWMAAKAEMAELNPSMNTNSEEFLQLAAKRFEEVVNLTQVYDSTLVRSQNMRSKSVFAKMATSFMAEPTLTWNMLMDGWNRNDPKAAVKAVGIFLLSQIATEAVKSLWTAGRDDDEEKPWLEKYLAAVGGELGGWGGSINFLNLIPYVRDVMSLLEGYDVERADMALVDQLLEEATKWINGKYEEKPEEGAKNMAFALSNLLGIPMKNIWRDVTTGINTWKDATDPRRAVNSMVLTHDALGNFVPWADVSYDAYYRRVYEAMKAGDTKQVEELKAFLAIQGKDEKAVASGVKKVMKELYKDQQITQEEAKAYLLEHGLVEDEKAAFQTVDRWEETPEKDDPEYSEYSYSAYDTVKEAIDAGDPQKLKAAVKELTDNGWSEDSVYQQVNSYVNKQYIAGALTQAQVKKYSSHDGWDDNSWYWHFRELDWAKDNGGSTEGWGKYNDYYSAVETGKNLKAVMKVYLDHGVTAQTLASNLTSKYKQEYIRLYKTNKAAAANLQARLLNAYVLLGYDRAKKQKDIAKWLEQ